jgi:tetratricopeptide (TPR) repeat protein
VPLSEAQASEYLADLQATLRKDILPRWYRLHCTNLLGILLTRLGRDNEALSLHLKTVQQHPSVTTLSNAGLAHLCLGHLDEALGFFEKALDQLSKHEETSRDHVLILSNIAWVYWLAGQHADALSSAQMAIEAADPQDAFEQHLLANRLATMNHHHEAAEFFARSLALRQGFELGEESAADVLKRLRGQYEDVLEQNPALRDSVAFALAFEEELQASEPENAGEDHDGTLAMFEATRPMRERANAAVLPGVESS